MIVENYVCQLHGMWECELIHSKERHSMHIVIAMSSDRTTITFLRLRTTFKIPQIHELLFANYLESMNTRNGTCNLDSSKNQRRYHIMLNRNKNFLYSKKKKIYHGIILRTKFWNRESWTCIGLLVKKEQIKLNKTKLIPTIQYFLTSFLRRCFYLKTKENIWI